MLKSTGLVHLATIYIDAVSVFKSWHHRKSGDLTFWSKFQHGCRSTCRDLPPTLLHDLTLSFQHHCMVFWMLPCGLLKLSGSSNKPLVHIGSLYV